MRPTTLPVALGLRPTGDGGVHTWRDFGRGAAKMGGLTLLLLVGFAFTFPLCGDAVGTWYPACDGGVWWWMGHWTSRVLLALTALASLITVTFCLAMVSTTARRVARALRLLAPRR